MKPFKEYHAPVRAAGMKVQKDVYVEMRDGQKLCIDIYLPDTEGPFPVLLSFGQHNKDLLDCEYTNSMPAQPAWSHFWFGNIESGDTKFIVSRGYVHILAQARGAGKSGDGSPFEAQWDHYDLIEWIAAQDWCDGNVGMCGLSNFGMNQVLAAMEQPPHLKAIFPQDPGAYYGFFHELHLGGVFNTLFYHLDHMSVDHMQRTAPVDLPEPMETLWKKAMENPDYKMYKNIYNLLLQKGQSNPLGLFFPFLLYPYDDPSQWEGMVKAKEQIKIPIYTGSGQYAIDYHFHWQGCQNLYEQMHDKVPMKLLLEGPAHQERPFHNHDMMEEMMKWYDYWLKGIDTGIMDEPPVKYWVTGENKWRYATNWPIPETQWTPFYFDTWERLRERPYDEFAYDGTEEPDSFVQMPPTLTNEISKLRYMTDPLAEDVTIAGPISATIYAALDSEDTNWFVTLKDLGPDCSDRTGRKGEWEIPELPEKYLTKGMLKASMRELDEEKSTPYRPWHKLTKEAQKMVVPGEINEYNIEVMSVCHTFKAGHRICVEISCLDLPDGACCVADTEYIPYHICRNATVLHKIYRDAKHPSKIILPIIPNEESGTDK
ncbi:MAG: CocE/NonD family hydrolase [Lachnospiraceae bacterium]|nr:CocE/NonD family hydrolase [Lachnospiraceae bacterium]